MEFDKSRILTVVTADQAKVGSMGYFSNYIPALKGYVTEGYNKHDILRKVSLDAIYPFSNGHSHYSLFYPASEPTYAERQAEWVKENNVKAGTRIRIIRKWKRGDSGFDYGMGATIGETYGVTHILDSHIAITEDWAVPYFALEVIKEPTYEERQEEWIKKHNFKEGDKVKILRTAEGGEDGWCNSWTPSMSRLVGSVFTYDRASKNGIWLSCGYSWPYFVLEVVKEPTYRPFNNDELNDLVGEVLTNKQSGRKKLVTGKPQHGVNLDGSYISAKDLLASFYRNTDEPCGVREET